MRAGDESSQLEDAPNLSNMFEIRLMEQLLYFQPEIFMSEFIVNAFVFRWMKHFT